MAYYIPLAVPSIILLAVIFGLIRNWWVFDVRMRLLHVNYGLYKKLPEYDAMMYRFWVWSVKKFLPKEIGQ